MAYNQELADQLEKLAKLANADCAERIEHNAKVRRRHALTAMLDPFKPISEGERQAQKRQATRGKRRCYGLPQNYPLFWQHIPHSNSLMLEFKLVRSKSND